MQEKCYSKINAGHPRNTLLKSACGNQGYAGNTYITQVLAHNIPNKYITYRDKWNRKQI